MATKHGIFQSIPRGGMAGFAALALTAIFLAACAPEEDKDPDPDPPPAASNVQLYTVVGNAFTAYSGSGEEQTVTGEMSGSRDDPSVDIGSIGTISADGKLTLNMPATLADDKLPSAQDGVKTGRLVITPTLQLRLSTDSTKVITIFYINNPYTADGVSLTKGWNYLQTGGGTTTVITDISAYNWVIGDN